jgi:hypothetical protein
MNGCIGWLRELIERFLQWLRDNQGGGGTIPDDKCCHLARKDKECMWAGAKQFYTCPPGYYRQWWYCCEGTQQLGCGECTTNPDTCWSGSFECSIFWETGESC